MGNMGGCEEHTRLLSYIESETNQPRTAQRLEIRGSPIHDPILKNEDAILIITVSDDKKCPKVIQGILKS